MLFCYAISLPNCPTILSKSDKSHEEFHRAQFLLFINRMLGPYHEMLIGGFEVRTELARSVHNTEVLCRYQFHPKPSLPRQIPGTRLEGSKNPPPRDNHCVQKPSPRDKTGSQKPHPWDIKLENFTNVSINSHTI